MRAFWACYLGEVKKLSLKKKYITLIIISALVCAVFSVISSAVGRLADMSDGVFLDSVAMTVMPVFTQLVMPLVAMMGAPKKEDTIVYVDGFVTCLPQNLLTCRSRLSL